ncbi:hypothetical protein [Rudanella lutea]|uniref:hypothetical protein n=1 Tax=Rudanella lutea TaxID=451374 RepID=UPI0012FAC2A4|nr:hypothetical protein [Rudanella lutea]
MARRFWRLGLSMGVLGVSLAGRAEPPDSLRVANRWLGRERFPIRVRSVFMATDNKTGLTDSYAWGVGVGLGYQTPVFFRHLQLGGTVFVSKNLLSSDLATRDPLTNQPNRYEAALFDLRQPGSHRLMHRMESLYAQWRFGPKGSLTVGRQLPRSPFINPQDGRLAPTMVEGLVGQYDLTPNTRIQVEYLWRMGPRSTLGWYGIGQSVGQHGVGVDAEGRASQYAGNTRSGHIVQLGFTHKIGPVVVQLWDTRVANLFNMSYLRADANLPAGGKRGILLGIQAARQWAVGEGGNPEPAKAYIPPGSRSLTVSGRVGYQTPRWTAHLNATRITAEGRFLMPREWGRDPWYTFLTRERSEGTGDMTALSANVILTPGTRFRAEVGAGYYHLPDVKRYRHNKYGLPAYSQVNLNLNYAFAGQLNGLETGVLWVYKGAQGPTYNNLRYVYNRVDMSQFNVLINYHL